MSTEDPVGWEIDWQKHCIVCGKSVLDGEGFCHMRVEEENVAVCCPLCFETFEKNPRRYLTLRRLRQE
jgi:predicted nucleic acid-binding Zn ribbon protein